MGQQHNFDLTSNSDMKKSLLTLGQQTKDAKGGLNPVISLMQIIQVCEVR